MLCEFILLHVYLLVQSSMVKLYGKLDKALMELNYFLNNSWKVYSV